MKGTRDEGERIFQLEAVKRWAELPIVMVTEGDLFYRRRVWVSCILSRFDGYDGMELKKKGIAGFYGG